MGKRLFLFVFIAVIVLSQMSGPAIALDIDVWIDAGTHYYVYITDAESGGTIEGDFTVTSGNDVEFFICDADNYDKWINGQSANVYQHRSRTTTYSFEFTIPTDDTWYVVFSNEYSIITSKHLEGYVDYSAPAAYIPPPAGNNTMATVVGFGFGIIVLIVLIGVVVKFLKGRDSQPVASQDTYYEVVAPASPPKPAEFYSPPQEPVVAHPFCSHCGTSRPPTAKFCANCGAQFETD